MFSVRSVMRAGEFAAPFFWARVVFSGPKRGKGRPPGNTDAGKIAFRLPRDHFEYLEHLVSAKRRLGDTVNDAARFILIRELDAMLKDGYHNKDY